ncbi:alpha/beta fold hydrolase [Euhalothece natronophila Z-M001]|uniref:Alpha/beta fold hydrolase n=1 Tax=Euhalothece natronophila Z-M001 TaxID=522448 RepID=A0A5B8NL20_9CHRO|nr:alpha/beta fold hydrolase [Euhalothece natronophila]QDZ39668.1 alpha/beta fold hydrolase [Euhalothece natronophila Z-M001]
MTQSLTQEISLTREYWQWQGYKTVYTVQGEGQPLLLIHGFGASVGHWRKNIPMLADAGYKVFAIDLLGFGGSDKPALDYSVELWQQQLYDFWEAKINEPTVFVGNSIGGLLTLMMLTQYPEISTGGVLINCAGGLNHRPEELQFPLNVIMGTFTQLVATPGLGKFVFNQVRRKSRIRNTLKQVYRDRAAITDELVDLLYQPSCDPGAHKVFASVLTAPAGPKPKDLLPQVQCPLLVLWGEDDPWTPISGAKIYQDRSESDSQVEFYPIPQAGHCAHDEKPEAVNELIINWLLDRQ